MFLVSEVTWRDGDWNEGKLWQLRGALRRIRVCAFMHGGCWCMVL